MIFAECIQCSIIDHSLDGFDLGSYKDSPDVQDFQILPDDGGSLNIFRCVS